MRPRFIWKKTCSTCRKARIFLQKYGLAFDEREINAEPLTAAELDSLIGERDYKKFLNFRNELYRAQNMKSSPPERGAALKLMAEHSNLIRRPILVVGDQIELGFEEAAWKERLSNA